LAAARGLDSVLLVLSTRPLAGDAAHELGRLVEEPGVELLGLGGFANDDIRSIVQARLGVTDLERAVGDFVQEKAQGNPYFAEELALALHETGVVETADGRCRFAPGAQGGRDLHLPGTVQGVVTSRVDRLPPLEQLTLKTASVIGRRFPFRTLSAVYPVEAERPELPGALGRLEALGMTPRLPDEPDLTHVFRHVVTRDVVYGLMLSEQRRGLHRAVADWLEATRGDDLAPLYAALAHHWKEAGEAAKALEYLDLAAGRAVRDCASTEAVELLTEAMELADRAAVDGDPLRRARWARWLGESFEGLGKLDEARAHCERALELLGFPRPSSSAGFVLASALALGRQALHRLFPGRFLGRHRGSRSRLEAGRLHEKLAEIEFLQDRTAPIVHATVCALNLAESVGSAPEMARTYASVGIAAGCSPLRGLAEGYFARAREAVSRQSDPNSEMWALTAEAFYCLGVGRWRRARERLDRAQELAGQVQNRWRELEAVGMLGDGSFFQADLDAAEQAFTELHEQAAGTSNVHLQAWGLAGRAAVALRRGRHGAAVEWLETALELLTAAGDLTPARGMLAVAYLRGDARRGPGAWHAPWRRCWPGTAGPSRARPGPARRPGRHRRSLAGGAGPLWTLRLDWLVKATLETCLFSKRAPDGSQQVIGQHLAGGCNLLGVSEHTDRPDGHLDSFAGTVRKLLLDELEGLFRDWPRVVVAQDSFHTAAKVIARGAAQEPQHVEGILVRRSRSARAILNLVNLGYQQRAGPRDPHLKHSVVCVIKRSNVHDVGVDDDPIEPSHDAGCTVVVAW
jgi:tetratricopeptide (TPR) repeat protein